MASLETFSDFHVDMEFTSSYQESQDTEAWWGLFFRSDLKGNQYLLRTDFSGRVTLDKYESGMQPFVLAWGEMGSIRSNHRTMEVEAESSWMRVWIDEELVIQYQDPDPLMGGKVGIMGQNAEIIVHNLVLYSQGITE